MGGPLVPVAARAPGNGLLGCASEYTIAVVGRCGSPRLCEIQDETIDLVWGRKLDDISEASVTLGLSGIRDSLSCCTCIKDIEPWCHELAIWRDDEFVWTGPIYDVTYGIDTATIKARDVLSWLDVRYSELGINTTQTVPGSMEITAIADIIFQAALSEDDPCILAYIEKQVSTIQTGIKYKWDPFQSTTYQMLLDLAGLGLDFTTIGRTVFYAGVSEYNSVPVATITDEDILGDVTISKRGDLMGNRWIVRWHNDDQPLTCFDAGVPCPIPPAACACPAEVTAANKYCYGIVERLKTTSGALSLPTAIQAAQNALASTQTAPHAIDFSPDTTLSPEARWEINDMICGQSVLVNLSNLCVPISEAFRLQELKVHVVNGEETVGISLGPVNLNLGELQT